MHYEFDDATMIFTAMESLDSAIIGLSEITFSSSASIQGTTVTDSFTVIVDVTRGCNAPVYTSGTALASV